MVIDGTVDSLAGRYPPLGGAGRRSPMPVVRCRAGMPIEAGAEPIVIGDIGAVGIGAVGIGAVGIGAAGISAPLVGIACGRVAISAIGCKP